MCSNSRLVRFKFLRFLLPLMLKEMIGLKMAFIQYYSIFSIWRLFFFFFFQPGLIWKDKSVPSEELLGIKQPSCPSRNCQGTSSWPWTGREEDRGPGDQATGPTCPLSVGLWQMCMDPELLFLHISLMPLVLSWSIDDFLQACCGLYHRSASSLDNPSIKYVVESNHHIACFSNFSWLDTDYLSY